MSIWAWQSNHKSVNHLYQARRKRGANLVPKLRDLCRQVLPSRLGAGRGGLSIPQRRGGLLRRGRVVSGRLFRSVQLVSGLPQLRDRHGARLVRSAHLLRVRALHRSGLHNTPRRLTKIILVFIVIITLMISIMMYNISDP